MLSRDIFDSKFFPSNQVSNFLKKYVIEGSGRGDVFEGCVADYFDAKYSNETAGYLEFKEDGNIALKEGKFKEAITFYSNALLHCHDSLIGLNYLISKDIYLSAFGKQVFGNSLLIHVISAFLDQNIYKDMKVPPEYLSDCPSIPPTVRQPNKAAAICYSNRSVAYFQLNLFDKALDDAESSIKLCPEYAKGYYRKLRALEKLGGRVQDVIDLKDDIRIYESLIKTSPSYAVALLSAGWMSCNDLILYHGDLRLRIIIAWISARLEGTQSPTVNVTVSLVPFQSFQYFTANIIFMSDWKKIEFNAVGFYPADHEGANMLDLPPHGHPTPQAASVAPVYIRNFVREIHYQGLQITGVFLGQGLVGLVNAVAAELVKFEDILGPIQVAKVMKTQHGYTMMPF